MFGDIHQNAQARERAQQRTSAGADHGERNAFGRHHSQNDAHIDQALHHHGGGDAQGEVAAEIVIHAEGGAPAAPEDEEEAEQQTARTNQAKLFADDRVNEIGMRLGEVEELLAAVHQAEADGTARADRDLGLLQLVIGIACSQRFFELRLDTALAIELVDDLELGVEEFHDARQTVGRSDDEEANANQRYGAGNSAVAPFETGHEEDDGGGRAQNHGGAQVGHDDRQNDQTHCQRRRNQGVAGAVDCAAAPGHEECEEDDERRFGHLRWLQTQWPQVQPAVMRGIEEIDDGEQQQGDADRAERHGRILEIAVMSALERHHYQDRHYSPGNLADDEVPGGAVLQLRHNRRRAIQDQHAKRHHHQHGGK